VTVLAVRLALVLVGEAVRGVLVGVFDSRHRLQVLGVNAALVFAGVVQVKGAGILASNEKVGDAMRSAGGSFPAGPAITVRQWAGPIPAGGGLFNSRPEVLLGGAIPEAFACTAAKVPASRIGQIAGKTERHFPADAAVTGNSACGMLGSHRELPLSVTRPGRVLPMRAILGSTGFDTKFDFLVPISYRIRHTREVY
jgi:hypothetical protein